MNFWGLGLPPLSFERFTNLLNIASNNNATCQPLHGTGDCQLEGKCSNYPGLWEYSFNIKFDSDASNYILVPLASFVSDETINNVDICKVYVQYLPTVDSTATYDMSIILGTMFFQSFSMYAS
jgi:hypothetical protein